MCIAGVAAQGLLPCLPLVGLTVSEWKMLWELRKEVKYTNISWWCYYYYYLQRLCFQKGRGRFVSNLCLAG